MTDRDTDKMQGRPLKGRHALVTGASRGIGAAVAEALARLGANVTLLGRDRAALEERANAVARAYDIDARPETADVGEADQVAAAFRNAVAGNGPVSILVNNAGAAESAPFHRTEPALWETALRVNLTGTFVCTRAALPDMLKAGYGRIVNVASTAGLRGYAYVSAYCAAKHGVIGLTRALALETARKGITVNAVCPGYTDTDMTRETIDNIVAKTGRTPEEATGELVASNPQRRLIQPWEVAETVAWLALPASSSITGQAVPVAGGEVT